MRGGGNDVLSRAEHKINRTIYWLLLLLTEQLTTAAAQLIIIAGGMFGERVASWIRYSPLVKIEIIALEHQLKGN